jgi:hypothetical protein
VINAEIDDIDDDTCISGISLAEQSCENGQQRTTIYNCPEGCSDGACKKSSGMPTSMDSCLDNLSYYWDQETDRCYSGYSKEIIKSLCSDPDGGKNIYQYAHTFGFRSYSSAEDPSRDLRIRTGGADGCISDKQIVENYCDENGFIQTTYLDCPNGCKDNACVRGAEVKEQIKCIFRDSKEEQQCYIAGQIKYPDDEGIKYCNGVESCTINVAGYKSEQLTWKSTCGGYSYTTLDGIDESVEFNCRVGETNPAEIVGLGFKSAYWQCYDGVELKLGDETSCKSSEIWQKYANDFCDGHCYSDESKCGVNSFAIMNECYLDEEKITLCNPEEDIQTCCSNWAKDNNIIIPACLGGWNIEMDKCIYTCKNENPEPGLVCKDSCPLDGKCYPFSYRKSGEYCSDEGIFKDQLSSNKKCDNNFECKSNVCVSGECISEGLINKMLNWFRRLFGEE